MLDIQAFDIDSIKNFNKNVEFVSFEDIKAVMASNVIEAEQEFSALVLNDYQDGYILKNHELSPCSFGDEPEIYHSFYNNRGWRECKGYLIKKDGSKFEGVWRNGQLLLGRIYYIDGSLFQGTVLSFQPR